MPVFSTHSGLVVTAESREAASAVEAFESNLLGLRKELDNVPSEADRFLETPMLQACAAVYFIYGQSQQTNAMAAPYLERAESMAALCTEREQSFIRAIRLFLNNAFHDALLVLEAQTERYPHDLLAAKIAEFLYYCLGQHYSGHRFQAHMQRLEKANADSAGYWSMRSFATELCGDYEAARPEAERSLALDAFQPWAHHTLAHLISRGGRIDAGLAEMDALMPMWRQAIRGIHCHNAWHLALLYLDVMDLENTEKVLHEDLWGITPNTVFEQVDTIALLWRMDLAGVRKDDIWQDIANRAEQYAGQCLIPFLDGHFAYALARAGKEDAAQMAVAKAFERANQGDIEAREVWAPVGAEFVAACADFGRGKTADGAVRLEPIISLVPKVGGSDAQDDLFRQAYISGLRDGGKLADAETTFDRFYGAKWRTAFDDKLLN